MANSLQKSGIQSVKLSNLLTKQAKPLIPLRIILRKQKNHVSGYPTSLADEEFARLVELKTEGRVKVEVREGGALAQNEGDAIEGLQSGDLAFTRVSND